MEDMGAHPSHCCLVLRGGWGGSDRVVEGGMIDGGERDEWEKRRECVRERCHRTGPGKLSKSSIQRSAGTLKQKPCPEHNSW